METFLRLLFLAGLIALGASMPYGIPHLDPSLNELWTEFKNSFNKEYISDETEILRRYIWERNFQRINKHNFESSLGQHSFWLGINQYSDMMDHEFKQVMNGFGLSYSDYSRYNSTLRFMDEDVSHLPKKVDWRKEGYVTEVKNQGSCGSCWAFSATGSLEGQYFKKTGKLVSLSEQDLVDCAGPCGNNGCGGGTMDGAFTCIAKEGGIDSESNYPYIAKDSTCRFNRKESVTTLKNYVDIRQFSENALQKAVATIGPISVAIDASDFAFSQYRSGVYENSLCSPVRLDHGVLVVGYGTDHGKDYWLVKNSWGPSWGLNGYIKMARNENNMCGIATMASYPVV